MAEHVNINKDTSLAFVYVQVQIISLVEIGSHVDTTAGPTVSHWSPAKEHVQPKMFRPSGSLTVLLWCDLIPGVPIGNEYARILLCSTSVFNSLCKTFPILIQRP
ncbi:hypothetical protein H4219_004289 [Mycoemilia scoparia]|uniref:Uncharacterized protein n=1 Tax=Mycoemilia scoparia TaxID=417184 RepID=A0A9W8DLQ1_9FUNG|nr:hypothetical protein H4219_004289 [Mycoemilia scoparia]